jgi:hypothetical protein
MTWRHYLSVGLAMITCPCRLPLLMGVLAGTAVGGWLSRYTWVVFGAMLGVFVLLLWYSLSVFKRRRTVCKTGTEHTSSTDRVVAESSAIR